MQSETRKAARIAQGLQNTAPHSTKIAKCTDNGKLANFNGFRKGRFTVMFKPLYDWQVKRNIIRAKNKIN